MLSQDFDKNTVLDLIVHNYSDMSLMLHFRQVCKALRDRFDALKTVVLPFTEDIKLAEKFIRDHDSQPELYNTPNESKFNTVVIYPLNDSTNELLLEFRSKWVDQVNGQWQEASPRTYEIWPLSTILSFSNKQYCAQFNTDSIENEYLNRQFLTLSSRDERHRFILLLQKTLQENPEQSPEQSTILKRLLVQSIPDLQRLIESLQRYQNPVFQDLIPHVNAAIKYLQENDFSNMLVRHKPGF